MALTKIPGSLIEASGNLTITDLTVTGDLSITGDLNSYNVTDLDVVDQTITLGAGQTEALSGGSGIIIDGSSASILWDETNDEWDFNKSINVTGTATMDGLTVAKGSVGTLGSFSGDDVSGARALEIIASTTTNVGDTHTLNAKSTTGILKIATTNTARMGVFSTGIGFYEDTGTTVKLFWDASAERLGIGTTSPDTIMEIVGADPILTIRDTSTSGANSHATLRLAESGASDDLNLHYDIELDETHLTFNFDNGSGVENERMRLDSSGNLLVGKTVTDLDLAGSALFNTGQAYHTRSGDTALYLKRLSSDGTIIDFRKDSTTVGIIGTNSTANFRIFSSQSGHSGLEFGTAAILPSIEGVLSNGGVDLGISSLRFKDLYLSGGVYLGGTGAANHLDDYEEGTWTPVLNDSGAAITNTAGTTYNWYVKVGRVVHVSANIKFSAADNSGNSIRITGLPFTTSSSVAVAGSMISRFAGSVGTIAPYINGSALYFYLQSSSSTWRQIAYNDVGQYETHLSITYQTT